MTKAITEKERIRAWVTMDIFKDLNFKGVRMVFRYVDEKGREKWACLDGRKLAKTIDWDHKF